MKLILVPARSGLRWARLGVQTFFKQPLAMAGLFFMFMALMTVATLLPVLGLPLAMTILPSATLGLMVATREVTQGKFPMPWALVKSLLAKPGQARSLLVLGLLYALGFIGVLGLSYLVDGGGFARMYLGGEAPSKELMESSGFIAAMWTFIGLHLPLSLLFWHAPALVYWHDLPTAKSMFFSLVACFRNFWAFTLFAAAWMGLMLGMVLLIMILAGLLDNPAVASTLLFPALMLMASMFFTSLYFSYLDCFEAEAVVDPADPPTSA